MTEIESYIVIRVNNILHHHDAHIVKRLEGGMSNYTYVVESNGKKYTYRVPGKFAERFVDRVEEYKTIILVDELNINNETVYLEVETGEKLALYVEGTILSDTDIISYNKKSVEALKRIHSSSLELPDYNAFGRLDTYERYCIETGYSFDDEYKKLRATLDKARQQFSYIKKVPCHCDYQPTNLVFDGSKLFVLDWEFAGMNDPIYDIACYGNAGFDKALALLKEYVGGEPTAEEYSRLYFHRSFQCLQWFTVAIFKDRIGLSKDLNLDFNAIAKMFFSMAKDLADKI